MKKFFTLLTAVFVSTTMLAQEGMFYKAKFLKAQFNTVTEKVTISDEEFNAVKDLFPGLDKAGVIAELNKSPFMPGGFTAQAGSSGVAAFGFAPGGLGGLDVTKFANAIADIMIERAKQELTIAFFNRFKKLAEENPEFQILFPATTNNLSNLLTFTYPQMLPRLRDGFFDDIEQIPFHLEALLELPRYRTLLEKFPEVRVSIRSLKLVRELEDGTITAADVITKFAAFPEWTESGSVAFMNVGATVKFMAILSESLRYENNTRLWLSTEEARELADDDQVLLKIYLSLLWAKIDVDNIIYHLPDNSGTIVNVPLQQIIRNNKDNTLLILNKISQFIRVADKVNESFVEIKGILAAGKKPTNENFFHYINVSLDVIDFSFGIVSLFDERLHAEDYLVIARKCNNLYKDVYTKAYTQAVGDALDIVVKIHELTKPKKGAPAVATSSANGAESHKNASDKLITFIERVKPYALFMANMIEAKDDKEVKAALENVILPVGSSSIKKHARYNVAVQSYLGAFWNLSNKKPLLNEGTWGDRFGVTAPVGISWTPGFASWKKGGSISLFGALFDIGAIVDYKLKKEPDATSNDPAKTVITKDYKIELGQIFSPGVYLVYGFGGNLPLSFGFGAQYGPGLSKIDANNDPVITNPAVRWNFFLAVDLPFFNIANKTKSK